MKRFEFLVATGSVLTVAGLVVFYIWIKINT